MGGRGSLYSSDIKEMPAAYWHDIPNFSGDSPAVLKYKKLYSEYEKYRNLDVSRAASGYRQQNYELYRKKLISAYAAVQRDTLINLSTSRLSEVRQQADKNASFYRSKLVNRNAASGGANASRTRFYEKRLVYYQARSQAALSQLRAIQLRENVRRKK